MKSASLLPLLALGGALWSPAVAAAAEPAISPWVAKFNSEFSVVPDVLYRQIGSRTLTVDLYLRKPAAGLRRTVVYIHGGAWAHGNKSWELGYMLPWMQLGWSVISVEYRLSPEVHAPDTVGDCFAALHWVGQHAEQYHFDLKHLVITGASAGGNLALLVAMAPPEAGFDHDNPGPLPRPAAIVNIAGVVDVSKGLPATRDGRTFTADWLGGADQFALARRVSPITYVRPGLPPILTVHGDSDHTVPYEATVRFHAALEKAGVPNQLLTIYGGGHGGWKPDDYIRIYDTMTKFLKEHGL